MEAMSPQMDAMTMDPEMLKARIAERKAKDKEEEEARLAAEAARDVALDDALSAGKAAFAAGDYSAAEKHFDVALDTNMANRPEVLCNRAAALIKLGRFEDAACDASEASDLEPSMLKAHYRLACALKALGRRDCGLKACRAALALQPDHAQLVKLLGELEGMEAAEEPAGPLRPSSARPCKGKSQAEKDALKAQLMRLELERGQARQSEAAHDWDAPGPRRDNM
jgi:Flp pilus assembly protein TadD